MTRSQHIPGPVAAVLRSPVIGHLATCGGGVPHATPVWVELDASDRLRVNVGAMTKKARNVRRNPRVCLSMVAAHDAGLWVVIEGIVEAACDATDTEHLDGLAIQYLGRKRRNPEMPRVILTIRLETVHWWNDDDHESSA